MNQFELESQEAEQTRIDPDALIRALCKMYNTKITHVEYRAERLRGGDVGNVRLVTGVAEDTNDGKLPYKVVLKTQKRWERLGSPDSWRREYDLYSSGLDSIFYDSFRWPMCYHSEIDGAETQIWMECIDGVSGSGLTVEMLVRAATELGRFHGRLCLRTPDLLQNIENLSALNFMKADYGQWKPETVEYRYIRSDDCAIPRHLREMLIEVDERADSIFENIERLPVVLCHRDFWIENIFYTDDKLRLIDWDTSGWGYIGEDLASLIVDETDTEHMEEYWRRCVPAYFNGIAESVCLPKTNFNYIWEMMIIKFGYRFVHNFMFAESAEIKTYHIEALQKIYEMGEGYNENNKLLS